MDLFHGTSKKSKLKILGPPPSVDVSIGGGELGKGFYLGESLALAVIWAKGRFPNPTVLEFNIANSSFAQLAFKKLNHREVLNDWHQLKRLNIHREHIYKYDIIFGPFATNPFAVQYKFESIIAQNLLNNSIINELL